LEGLRKASRASAKSANDQTARSLQTSGRIPQETVLLKTEDQKINEEQGTRNEERPTGYEH
ncbi:MAG: hypothetical protein Q8S19_00580, partial [Bacillota bacterium]|nr:hypothetical protein [Bacillota bacterium]